MELLTTEFYANRGMFPEHWRNLPGDDDNFNFSIAPAMIHNAEGSGRGEATVRFSHSSLNIRSIAPVRQLCITYHFNHWFTALPDLENALFFASSRRIDCANCFSLQIAFKAWFSAFKELLADFFAIRDSPGHLSAFRTVCLPEAGCRAAGNISFD